MDCRNVKSAARLCAFQASIVLCESLSKYQPKVGHCPNPCKKHPLRAWPRRASTGAPPGFGSCHQTPLFGTHLLFCPQTGLLMLDRQLLAHIVVSFSAHSGMHLTRTWKPALVFFTGMAAHERQSHFGRLFRSDTNAKHVAGATSFSCVPIGPCFD